MTSTTSPAPPMARRARLALIWTASAAVIAASLVTAFRLPFASDLSTLLSANGPRVLVAAAVGSLLALSGALRLLAGDTRAWGELERLGLATGAAGGGFALTMNQAGPGTVGRFVVGAAGGALVLWSLIRTLDRPKRWTNLAVAPVLVLIVGTAALAGAFARARSDFVAPAVAWLLGDLGGATLRSGLALLAVFAALLLAGVATTAPARWTMLAWIAFGVGIGAAGPLAFVSLMAPLLVRALTDGASPRVFLPAAAAAGAALVVAVDAVPRLLFGGYDFPWNVAAAMLALPGFLTWNRRRRRREAGGTTLAFEILEIALIAGLTLGAAALAFLLSAVIRLLT